MDNGSFRFTYFTEKYEETVVFYTEKLGFQVLHSWDRSENDKGSLFKAGVGAIEVLHAPDESHQVKGLDYRKAQGIFACLKVENATELYQHYASEEVPFKEQLADQDWGHRSFSIIDPNGVIIFFFEETF